MSVSDTVVRNIVKKLIFGEDHRDEVIIMFVAEFLNYTARFFKKVVEVSTPILMLKIGMKKTFLSQELTKNDIIVQAAKKHCHSLKSLI